MQYGHRDRTHLALAADVPQPTQMSRIAFGRYAMQWLEENVYALTPSTYASYRTAIRQHAVPFLGKLPLVEVTDAHLKRFIAHLQRLPAKRDRLMGPKSVNNYVGPIKAIPQGGRAKKAARPRSERVCQAPARAKARC